MANDLDLKELRKVAWIVWEDPDLRSNAEWLASQIPDLLDRLERSEAERDKAYRALDAFAARFPIWDALVDMQAHVSAIAAAHAWAEENGIRRNGRKAF